MKTNINVIITFCATILSGCNVWTKNIIGTPINSNELSIYKGKWIFFDRKTSRDTVAINYDKQTPEILFVTDMKTLATQRMIISKGESYKYFQFLGENLHSEKVYAWGIVDFKYDTIKLSYPEIKEFIKAAKKKIINAKIASNEKSEVYEMTINDNTNRIEYFIKANRKYNIFDESIEIIKDYSIPTDREKAILLCIDAFKKSLSDHPHETTIDSVGDDFHVRINDTSYKRGGAYNCYVSVNHGILDSIRGEK